MRATATQLLSSLILITGAAAATPALASGDATGAPPTAPPSFIEHGQATWYGPRHEGQRTTSGERFDSRKLTAAHPTLPMGSYVRVTLEENGRSIIVRVNDREPPHGVRCIDLSRAAASELGIVARGVAEVKLAQISPDEARADSQVEVAEAADDARPAEGSASSHRSTGRHGRQHRHRAHR
jgi:rare lipoprotein A